MVSAHPTHPPIPPTGFHRDFPGRADTIAAAREAIQRVLADSPACDAAVVVASELAANAIRHTRTGDRDGMYYLQVQRTAGHIWIGLTDDGGPRPHDAAPPGDEHGRGLMLVAALAQEWGYRTSYDGRRVTWALLREEETL